MKKSKIIIPALGMLLLSTAASVSGTVAWFTTVSTAQAEITSFAVRKLGGDLKYVVAAGTGTKKVTESSDTSAITLDGAQPALCDSSYDHIGLLDYKANSTATSFTALASESNWSVTGKDASNNDMVTYYAVSWSYTFTYTFGGDSTAVNLYLDSQGSTVTPTKNTDAATGHSEKTYMGFRIAFINAGQSRKVVWAKNQTASNCKYITSGTSVTYTAGVPTYTGAGAYSNANSDSVAGDLLDSTGLAPLGESASGTVTRADYLGQFTAAANTVTIKCVAWFEGTDPNVINEAEMDTVAAALNFYTRPLAA